MFHPAAQDFDRFGLTLFDQAAQAGDRDRRPESPCRSPACGQIAVAGITPSSISPSRRRAAVAGAPGRASGAGPAAASAGRGGRRSGSAGSRTGQGPAPPRPGRPSGSASSGQARPSRQNMPASTSAPSAAGACWNGKRFQRQHVAARLVQPDGRATSSRRAASSSSARGCQRAGAVGGGDDLRRSTSTATEIRRIAPGALQDLAAGFGHLVVHPLPRFRRSGFAVGAAAAASPSGRFEATVTSPPGSLAGAGLCPPSPARSPRGPADRSVRSVIDSRSVTRSTATSTTALPGPTRAASRRSTLLRDLAPPGRRRRRRVPRRRCPAIRPATESMTATSSGVMPETARRPDGASPGPAPRSGCRPTVVTVTRRWPGRRCWNGWVGALGDMNAGGA